MASCMVLQRDGHLSQLYHYFAYLRDSHNTELVFDPTKPEIDEASFVVEDWKDAVYGTYFEEKPPNAPRCRGISFKIVVYVDSDHAGDNVTRRSKTGFIIYLNSEPIFWSSKKQRSMKTSSFVSEFIAMKLCCEYLCGLIYKLRMTGIPCDFPSFVCGDNKSVLVNLSKPYSVLKKKSSSIAYNFLQKGCAKEKWLVLYVNTKKMLVTS